MSEDPTTADDPVVARRRRAARLATAGKRVGYSALLAAIGAFLVGAATQFTSLIATTVTVFLAISSALLLPAIILGYAVAKAEREDPGA